MSAETVLRLDGLTVRHPARGGEVTAVEDISLTVPAGRCVALVGESGSGKSTTLNALLGLTPATARTRVRRLEFADAPGGAPRPVTDPAALRGRSVGLVPQDPARALDPLVRIEGHFAELYRHFTGLKDRAEARRRTVAALAAVGVDRPEARLRQYPHELSGGLLQRVLVALALTGEPRLLLADEPTSNLDVTVQRRVLDLFDALRAERGLALLLVTHDLAVASQRADELIVLRGGRVVESGPTDRVIGAPRHPYTRQLVTSLPGRLPRTARPAAGTDAGTDAAPAAGTGDGPPVVLAARGLAKSYPGARGSGPVAAVRGVDLTLRRGRTLAVVGESGAGKTTLLRLLTGLERPDAGTVLLDGTPVGTGRRARVAFTRRVQLVHQNPAGSLNPALTIGRIIAEPLAAHRIGTARHRAERARALLEAVGLPAGFAAQRPARLSGGQAQRVAIARALALDPEVLVLDEPVSALDQAVQLALLELLDGLQRRLGIALLLVTHDLGVVRATADEVLVLHRGRTEEAGPADALFAAPTSPYTRALLDAVPALRLPETPPFHERTPSS
ncbi:MULTISPECIES: dipeptide ABC transporter ATP-binding protein [Streptomyces]|uniref:dipeptide ABC transporter ATP-binding protein n=1 Tax=Streptomyces TaxID=1883 RepID=UPI0015912613|nr:MULTISPECIES: ABC transporter ATP-binding protein [Streptomyces]QKV70671.1 ABC transporter ATP-binding protein [Streptomyces harbinensis]